MSVLPEGRSWRWHICATDPHGMWHECRRSNAKVLPAYVMGHERPTQDRTHEYLIHMLPERFFKSNRRSNARLDRWFEPATSCTKSTVYDKRLNRSATEALLKIYALV